MTLNIQKSVRELAEFSTFCSIHQEITEELAKSEKSNRYSDALLLRVGGWHCACPVQAQSAANLFYYTHGVFEWWPEMLVNFLGFFTICLQVFGFITYFDGNCDQNLVVV